MVLSIKRPLMLSFMKQKIDCTFPFLDLFCIFLIVIEVEYKNDC